MAERQRPNQTVSVNVGALSNALAVAIQQATTASNSNSAAASSADRSESDTGQGSSAGSSRYSNTVVVSQIVGCSLCILSGGVFQRVFFCHPF